MSVIHPNLHTRSIPFLYQTKTRISYSSSLHDQNSTAPSLTNCSSGTVPIELAARRKDAIYDSKLIFFGKKTSPLSSPSLRLFRVHSFFPSSGPCPVGWVELTCDMCTNMFFSFFFLGRSIPGPTFKVPTVGNIGYLWMLFSAAKAFPIAVQFLQVW